MATLSIVIESLHPVTVLAARELARAWKTAGGEAVRVLKPAPTGPRIRLALGSLVRPSVLVHYEKPFDSAQASAADHLALTIAAWDSLDDLEPWRALSAPLASIPHYGRPHGRAPWAVTSTRNVSLPSEHQLHVLGGLRPPAGDAVWWPPWAVAPVLGRAACVLGETGPLVWDARRAGIPIETSASPEGALAGLVPPSLLDEPRLWRHVVESARAVHETGCNPQPLMTPAWVAIGRDRIREAQEAPPSAWERLRRKRDKFIRDPRRFFADSRLPLLRSLGRAVFPS